MVSLPALQTFVSTLRPLPKDSGCFSMSMEAGLGFLKKGRIERKRDPREGLVDWGDVAAGWLLGSVFEKDELLE